MDDVIWSCPDCDGDLEPDWDGPGRGLWCPACEQIIPFSAFPTPAHVVIGDD